MFLLDVNVMLMKIKQPLPCYCMIWDQNLHQLSTNDNILYPIIILLIN